MDFENNTQEQSTDTPAMTTPSIATAMTIAQAIGHISTNLNLSGPQIGEVTRQVRICAGDSATLDYDTIKEIQQRLLADKTADKTVEIQDATPPQEAQNNDGDSKESGEEEETKEPRKGVHN